MHDIKLVILWLPVLDPTLYDRCIRYTILLTVTVQTVVTYKLVIQWLRSRRRVCIDKVTNGLRSYTWVSFVSIVHHVRWSGDGFTRNRTEDKTLTNTKKTSRPSFLKISKKSIGGKREPSTYTSLDRTVQLLTRTWGRVTQTQVSDRSENKLDIYVGGLMESSQGRITWLFYDLGKCCFIRVTDTVASFSFPSVHSGGIWCNLFC